jgi:hypothetical protein
MGTLNYQVSATEGAGGSPMMYAATHQYGDPRHGAPARPVLSLSEVDRTELLDILEDHLRRGAGGVSRIAPVRAAVRRCGGRAATEPLKRGPLQRRERKCTRFATRSGRLQVAISGAGVV